jgi:hypothetical protein
MSSGTNDLALCGVRLTRGGSVLFVDAAGHHLEPGRLVIIVGSDGEQIATVAIGSGQVVENGAAAAPVGRVLRIADEADIHAHGQRMAEGLGIISRARERCREAGAEVIAAWVTPDGSRATLTLARAVPQADDLARSLVALLGIDIALEAQDEGAARPISGVDGAALPADRAEWLVPPGATPMLLQPVDSAGELTAGAFIEQLFPADENWPPARLQRRTQPKGEPQD